MKKDITEQVHDLGYAADITDVYEAAMRVLGRIDPDESLARFGARQHIKTALDCLHMARNLLASPDVPS